MEGLKEKFKQDFGYDLMHRFKIESGSLCEEIAYCAFGISQTYFKENRWVQLDEDQSLPDNEYWHNAEQTFGAYCAGRNDMLKANFKKVKSD